MSLTDFLPAGLDPLMALALVALSFVTSLITATFSLGGGTLMVAVLAVVFPPAIVVPLHGAIQLGSNAGRAVVQRAHIQWNFVKWIAAGAVIGTVVGGQFATLLPEKLFTALIGAFVLITTWLPQPKVVGRSPAVQFVGGAIISGQFKAVYLYGENTFITISLHCSEKVANCSAPIPLNRLA